MFSGRGSVTSAETLHGLLVGFGLNEGEADAALDNVHGIALASGANVEDAHHVAARNILAAVQLNVIPFRVGITMASLISSGSVNMTKSSNE